MNRRRCLQLIAMGSLAVSIGKLMMLRRRRLSFYVAGARFGELPAGVRSGDQVRVRREPFESGIRLSLYTQGGHLLGYVPRELVPSVEALRPAEAKVMSVYPDSVPWKRYQLELIIS